VFDKGDKEYAQCWYAARNRVGKHWLREPLIHEIIEKQNYCCVSQWFSTFVVDVKDSMILSCISHFMKGKYLHDAQVS